jgi:nuclear pore complex protein Nup98-Nup96
MGRYTAHTSDLSDNEDDLISVSDGESTPSSSLPQTQPHDESDSEGSGTSSSEMQEDELMTSSPQRRATRDVVEGHDDEVLLSHEVEGREPSPPIIHEEPIPWAQQVGVDAQRMHVMQASLFRVPEEAAAMKTANQPIRPPLVLSQTLNRKHSRGPEGDVLHTDSQKVGVLFSRMRSLLFDCRSYQRASFAHPVFYKPTRKYARVDSASSTVEGNEGAIVDAGLAFGRSFGVGWGPSGKIVHLGELCGPFGRP